MIGIGGAGSRFVIKCIELNPGLPIRAITIDSDITTLPDDRFVEFIQVGKARLEGKSTGGNTITARTAVRDDAVDMGERFSGIRLAIVVTSLGKGFASGATAEILRIIGNQGINTLCIATLPFKFEGTERENTAKKQLPLIEERADSLITIPLDHLFAKGKNCPIEKANEFAEEEMAKLLSFVWDIFLKPGFITLNIEDLIAVIKDSGTQARVSMASADGEDRAEKAAEKLFASELLSKKSFADNGVTLVLGIIAGKDLRLAELGKINEVISNGMPLTLNLRMTTIVDEKYRGQIQLVALFFEGRSEAYPQMIPTTQPVYTAEPIRQTHRDPLASSVKKSERFRGVEGTIYEGQDLDQPTYYRRKLVIEK